MKEQYFRRPLFLLLLWRSILICLVLFICFSLYPDKIRSLWSEWRPRLLAQEAQESAFSVSQQPPEAWKIHGALAALNDSAPRIQAEALYTLLEMQTFDLLPDTVIPQIAALLDHPSPGIQFVAIEMLGKLGRRANAYVTRLAALLDHADPDIRSAAAKALGHFSEAGEEYLPRLTELLYDPESDVRKSAAQALHQLDQTDQKTYLEEMAMLLHDSEWQERAETASLLGYFGDDAAEYVPQLIELLADSKWEVRTAAARTLGRLGSVAEMAIPKLAALLQDDSWSVRAAAAKALSDMGAAAKAYVPHIVTLLQDPKWEVRSAAVWALGQLDTHASDYLERIAGRLDDNNTQVRAAAVEALGQLGQTTDNYQPQITAMLDDPDWEVRAAAARTLGQCAALPETTITKITELFDDPDWYVRSNAARALGTLAHIAPEALPWLAALLDDEDGNVRSAAVWALGNFGAAARPYKSQILRLLNDPHPGARYAAARALSQLGPGDLPAVVEVLNPLYTEPSRTEELRFLAHLLGAGSERTETLLQWVGQPGENYPDLETLSLAQARQTLQVFHDAWDAVLPFEKMRADMVQQIIAVITQMKSRWKLYDLALLRRHAHHLNTIDSPPAESISRIIWYVQLKSFFVLLALFLALHPLLWGGLLLLYPVSRRVRVWCFWNPIVRKFGGLGYVQVVLLRSPYLRQRLFEPFRDTLLADATLADFDEAAYFEQVYVTSQLTQETLPIQEAIPEIDGHIVLGGEAGLGKTMFCRYLLKHARRMTVYLPAQKCAQGLIQAIQPKLRGEGQDLDFLRELVCRGTLDLCIDGVNEISDPTRSALTQFMADSYQGNYLLTTRPIAWNPPFDAQVFMLRPLRQDQIEEFLINCHRILPEHITLAREEFAKGCQEYLGEVFEQSRSADQRQTMLEILTNPLNLTLIALLGVHGKAPELHQLLEQYYQLMAEDYERTHRGRPFPLIQFSERVYRMRRNDEATLPKYRFPDEMICLERYKMVFKRQSFDAEGKPISEWFFRHGTIVDYFIAQAFLYNRNHRFEQHLHEARFQGVYRLLPVLEQAEAEEEPADLQPVV